MLLLGRYLAQNKHLLGRNWPIRRILYDKNARGVPMLLGVFCPFFSHILVQNGHFIGIHKSNFMGKKRRFRAFFRK
jgi:hypothetical protein